MFEGQQQKSDQTKGSQLHRVRPGVVLHWQQTKATCESGKRGPGVQSSEHVKMTLCPGVASGVTKPTRKSPKGAYWSGKKNDIAEYVSKYGKSQRSHRRRLPVSSDCSSMWLASSGHGLNGAAARKRKKPQTHLWFIRLFHQVANNNTNQDKVSI